MADFLIKTIPLPVPRPKEARFHDFWEFGESVPSTDFKMPLGATEKLTDAFSEGARYHPTSPHIELTSGLLIALGSILVVLVVFNRKWIWSKGCSMVGWIRRLY